MKLISINPKQLFRSKSKKPPRSAVSGSKSSSFSSSSDDSTHHKLPAGSTTPTSVLPDFSSAAADADWSSDLSSELHSDLAHALKLIDRDDDGLISRQDLENFLTRLGEAREDVELMLADVDPEGRGSVRVEAILSRVGSGCAEAGMEDLKEAFEVFDSDRDGRISAEELLGFFKAVGDERCTLEECRRMIRGVDKNGDGFVCFEEFSRMMELQR